MPPAVCYSSIQIELVQSYIDQYALELAGNFIAYIVFCSPSQYMKCNVICYSTNNMNNNNAPTSNTITTATMLKIEKFYIHYTYDICAIFRHCSKDGIVIVRSSQ